MPGINLELEDKLLDTVMDLLQLKVGETITIKLKDQNIKLKRMPCTQPISSTEIPNATKMLPSIRMINYTYFESSSGVTQEQVAFWNAFRSDMKRILKGKIKRLKLEKNHFEMFGFFEANTGVIWYISTGDLRWAAKKYGMLIRTAKDFKDFTGGPNYTIMFDEHFEENLLQYVDKYVLRTE